MRPVLSKNKLNYRLWLIYAGIFIICVGGIAYALSKTEYFEDENLDRVIGIIDKNAQKEDEYNELKIEFDNIFTNQIENLEQENVEIKKINKDYDIVVTGYNYKEEKDNCSIDVAIPYINVNHQSAKDFNKKVNEVYKQKAESIKNQVSTLDLVYTVQYKAYLQNNILSLAIRSEYKEGNRSQKTIVNTFNYNVVEQKVVSIDDLLKIKNIQRTDATKKIRDEIKTIQDQNQALIDEGYALYKRDYKSSIYDIANCNQFLYGKNEMLYIVFPYGNQEDTSEMDVVIFE